MIQIKNRVFALNTEHTSYVFYADEKGNLIHLHYGEKVNLNGIEAIIPQWINPNGCSIIADDDNPNLCLDDVCLEISTRGKGDMREPFVEIEYEDGSKTSDFRYEEYRIEKIKQQPKDLPGAYDDSQKAQSLIVVMSDRNSGVKLELVYSVFEACDCITKFARIINNDTSPIKILRLMSAQLDADSAEWKISSFHGDWAREMQRYDVLLQAGKFMNDSSTGFSSNKANPFIMFGNKLVQEEIGECYACNLLYSGNHREIIEVGSHAKMRMLTGISPDFFAWILESGEEFDSPEAVITFSSEGYQGISKSMHKFVREHIVRGEWKRKERPILLNSWEATYFDVREKKILRLAKAAADAGIELFVLDDGWFGKRNSDKESLGDWFDNKEKLPQGLKGLSNKIHELGLQFGIWVEPEMISEDSQLYRNHPDWAIQIPGKSHALGRNQMILDLTQTQIQDYIIDTMSDVFTRSNADYVKWDMNRHISDYYGQELTAQRQGEFAHRYIKGLYRVMQTLTERFPNILFEACASGGNRFDLGMLCYMPQIWASDCTDAVSRANIQNGYSYGYPQSVIGAHVSGCPNHQTLRITPLASRFAVASAGILGYECNLCDVNSEELQEIKEQIKLYKQWREVFQFGQLYRLHDTLQSTPFDTDVVRWNIVAENREKAVGIVLQGQSIANFSHRSFRTRGLDNEKQYVFANRLLKYDIHRMGDLINTMSPIHVKQDSFVHDMISKWIKLDGENEKFVISGSILNKVGVQLSQSYSGTGFGKNTALYQDFDARMFLISEDMTDL